MLLGSFVFFVCFLPLSRTGLAVYPCLFAKLGELPPGSNSVLNTQTREWCRSSHPQESDSIFAKMSNHSFNMEPYDFNHMNKNVMYFLVHGCKCNYVKYWSSDIKSYSQPWFHGSSPFRIPIVLLQLIFPKCFLSREKLCFKVTLRSSPVQTLYVYQTSWSSSGLNALLKGRLAVVMRGGKFCSFTIWTWF